MRSDLLPHYVAHVRELADRTRRALASAEFDGLAIHSGTPLLRSVFDDNSWPLRLVPHFQHWAHLPWPDAVLAFDGGARPRLFYSRDRSFWERPVEPDFAAMGQALELVEVESFQKLKGEIAAGPRRAFIGENRGRGIELGFAEGSINPPALMAALDELRVHKTPFERACIAEANRIAARGHAAVARAFQGGERSELRLHLAYLEATEQDDPETPYKNIVAIGDHAATLHHVHYARGKKGDSLLLDAGACFLGYASDITRTMVAPGGDAGRTAFSGLIRAMEELQQALCAGASVGRPYEDLHDESHRRMAHVLCSAGIVKMSEEEAVQSGVTRQFYPHGLGHSLGLQTHDVGCAKVKPRSDNPFLRNTRKIEPEQVFTIEPGLYFIDTFMEALAGGPHRARIDWSLVEALKPFGGIRIEDDVRVLEASSAAAATGRPPMPVENLTRAVLPA
jgi:Xaa-Pro dipeptidase